MNKKNRKLIFGAIAAALVVLLGIGAIVTAKALGSPKVRFARAQNELLQEEVLPKFSIENLLTAEVASDFKNISTDAELTAKLGGLDKLSFINDMSVLFKIDADKEKQRFAAELNFKGSSLLGGSFEIMNDGIGVYIPELSDKYYIIDTELIKNALSSVYDEQGLNGSAMFSLDGFGMQKSEADKKIEFKRVKSIEKEYNAIKKRYVAIISKYVKNDDFEMNGGTKELAHFGTKLRGCKEITFTPDRERTAKLIEKIGEELKKDKALSDYVLSLMEHYIGNEVMNAVLSSIAQQFEEEDMPLDKGILPALEKLGDELIKNAGDIAEKLDAAKFKWNCIIKSGEIVSQRITFEQDGVINAIECEFDNENAWFCASEDGVESMTVESVMETSKGMKNGTVKIKNGDDFFMNVDIKNMDEKTKSAIGANYGEYRISFGTNDDFNNKPTDMTLIVAKSEKGGTDHKLVLNDVEIDVGEDTVDSVEINLRTSDKAASIDMPTSNIKKVTTDDELKEMGEELSEKITSLIGKFVFMIMR